MRAVQHVSLIDVKRETHWSGSPAKAGSFIRAG
jgi:hypothetical protein